MLARLALTAAAALGLLTLGCNGDEEHSSTTQDPHRRAFEEFVESVGGDPTKVAPPAEPAVLLGRVVVEVDSIAVRGNALAESIGIETLGGAFSAILPIGCQLPCTRTEVFSTAQDDQVAIQIAMYRGDAGRVANTTALGTFAVGDIPRGPRGLPQIVVTFGAVEGDIVIAARERSSSAALPISRTE